MGLIAALILAAAASPISAASSAQTRRLLVAFRPGAAGSERSAALRSLGARELEWMEEFSASVVEVPDAGAFSAFGSQDLSEVVEAVEEDVYVKWLGVASFQETPLPTLEQLRESLPLFEETTEHSPPRPPDAAAEVPWGVARVNAAAAWAKTQGEGVRVAVLDTGIDASHPELKGSVAGGYNAFDSKAATMDDNGHGTHVAGTIAAARDGRGVVGVAPKASLYAVKVLDKDGGANISSIIKGLLWCAKNDIQVANMSLGAPVGSLFMRMAVAYASSKGVAIVAAAGNNGKSVEYPGGYPEAIAVAASDRNDKIADFSSRGPKVEFIAPGVDVRSSLPGGIYAEFDGTSMATPHVAGLAALAVSRGARGPDGVRKALTRAARSIGLSPWEEGRGMIDAALLVR